MRKIWLIFLLLSLNSSCDSSTTDNVVPSQKVASKREQTSIPKPRLIEKTPEKPEKDVEAPFLWKVSHESGDSYILGILEAGLKTDDIVNDALFDKLKQSRIVFAFDQKALGKNLLSSREFYSLPEGKSLKKMMGKKDWKRLLARVPRPAADLDRATMWLAATAILAESFPVQTKNQLMEYTLTRYAELESRPISYLENWTEAPKKQVQAIDRKYLSEMLNQTKEQMDTEFAERKKHYVSGDEKALTAQYRRTTKSERNYHNIVYISRNKKWMKKIAKFLSAGRTFFVIDVVHLIGENNIIALLEADGFKVERVKAMGAE